ncbi:hypothetical protein M422DRAFT_272561 [Sphaerobolus stellatus SS14]|uniref:Uncharacterized protein n=1 Tax=Sphaerobolus stellatus (strain SS14) TaxID=990650 RepID=A0A0C9UBA4_SPHS4|nr:hypothetical protein M422DRAFT_272561 [Sphaerobolus stellatus SS14]
MFHVANHGNLSKISPFAEHVALIFEPWAEEPQSQDTFNMKIKPDLPSYFSMSPHGKSRSFRHISNPWKTFFVSPPAWSRIESGVEVKPGSAEDQLHLLAITPDVPIKLQSSHCLQADCGSKELFLQVQAGFVLNTPTP